MVHFLRDTAPIFGTTVLGHIWKNWLFDWVFTTTSRGVSFGYEPELAEVYYRRTVFPNFMSQGTPWHTTKHN